MIPAYVDMPLAYRLAIGASVTLGGSWLCYLTYLGETSITKQSVYIGAITFLRCPAVGRHVHCVWRFDLCRRLLGANSPSAIKVGRIVGCLLNLGCVSRLRNHTADDRQRNLSNGCADLSNAKRILIWDIK